MAEGLHPDLPELGHIVGDLNHSPHRLVGHESPKL
jgi:hypothetical protein